MYNLQNKISTTDTSSTKLSNCFKWRYNKTVDFLVIALVDTLCLGQSFSAIPRVINCVERMLGDFILCFDFTINIWLSFCLFFNLFVSFSFVLENWNESWDILLSESRFTECETAVGDCCVDLENTGFLVLLLLVYRPCEASWILVSVESEL